MVKLDTAWKEYLTRHPDTGYGYQHANITLHSGEVHENVLILDKCFIPGEQVFVQDDIAKIRVKRNGRSSSQQ